MYFNQKKFSLKMASKEAYVVPPPSPLSPSMKLGESAAITRHPAHDPPLHRHQSVHVDIH